MKWLSFSSAVITMLCLTAPANADVLNLFGERGGGKSCGCAKSCQPECCRPCAHGATCQQTIPCQSVSCCKPQCSAPCAPAPCCVYISTCFTPPTPVCVCPPRKCCPPEIIVETCCSCPPVIRTPPPCHKPEAPPMPTCDCCDVGCSNLAPDENGVTPAPEAAPPTQDVAPAPTAELPGRARVDDQPALLPAIPRSGNLLDLFLGF
jgi:hypothetical protein